MTKNDDRKRLLQGDGKGDSVVVEGERVVWAWPRMDQGIQVCGCGATDRETTINRSGDAVVGPIGSVVGEVEAQMSRKVGDLMSRVEGWDAAQDSGAVAIDGGVSG